MSQDEPPFDKQIPQFEWDRDQVGAFETAVALCEQVIGVFSARIFEAHQRGDDETVDALAQRQARYSMLRRNLRLDDPAQVTAIRQECDQVLAELG